MSPRLLDKHTDNRAYVVQERAPAILDLTGPAAPHAAGFVPDSWSSPADPTLDAAVRGSTSTLPSRS